VAIKVYDFEGKKRNLTYLRSRYGNFVIQPAAGGHGPAYKIDLLREKVNTNAVCVFTVKDADGTPLEGTTVAWYWPDAPDDANAGPKGGVPSGMSPNRCITGQVKADGDIGFAMGQGAYYWADRGEIGPHAAWIHGAGTRSDLVLGLGMIAGTGHNHFDVEYVRVDDGVTEPEPPEPEPPPEEEDPTEKILAELKRIERWTKKIDGSVNKIRKMIE
jgi:hypothetical protein